MTVEEENKWIEDGFNCNITKPFITEQEIELMDNGFKIEKEIPEDHVPLPKEHVDKIIERVNNSD